MHASRTMLPVAVFTLSASSLCGAESSTRPAIELKTDHFAWTITGDGKHAGFTDLRTGTDYAQPGPVAQVRIAGRYQPSTSARRTDDGILLAFGETGVEARLRVTSRPGHLTLEVASVRGEGVEELTFIDLTLRLKGSLDDPFAACALALNLRTNVHELPGPMARLRAMCYPRFGTEGAGVAIIGCPVAELRRIMQEAVSAAPDLPKSSLGGPWALDAPINKGSYLFNFADLSEEAADKWIDLARRTGMNQIDFHGGSSFRFGDLRMNPKTYPQGNASMKAVIDRLHAAGIAAGLHTYAFFLAKDSEWVSPVPDPRLAKDASFTLAAELSADAAEVPVLETTEKMSTITGFFVWNSVTLQIDDELITYSDVSKTPPYAFTKCKRGAWGTKATTHAAGAKVHHLKECFGLFLPDGESTLFSEVAARTADVFNACGFDMIYLDALDGEGIIGGPEAGWHYGSKFVFEICKRLKRPALMEMSTFHHHLWYVRSRYIAWDHPNRGHKAFIDRHCEANGEAARMFLPGHLGWWSVKMWGGLQDEPTYADDIEYLCCKCIGNDVGFSLMGVDPNTIHSVPAYGRYGRIMSTYEELRRSGKVPPAIREKLRVPGDEYTLVSGDGGAWSFRPVQYERHKVEGLQHPSAKWTVKNRFGAQPLRLRIEALLSPVAYDAPEAQVVADFREPGAWTDRAGAPGLSITLEPDSTSPKRERGPTGTTPAQSEPGESGRFVVASSQPADGKSQPSWARSVRKFDPVLNLKNREGLGLWVKGDASGALLNVQFRTPEHISRGVGDHHVTLDFDGWRYFELMELDNPRMGEFKWPYPPDPYLVYREMVHYDQVESISIWFNNVPPGKRVEATVAPVKALPLLTPAIVNPSITIGGKTVTFPVSIDTGCYLEWLEGEPCRLYARDGRVLAEVQPSGDVPTLQPGENAMAFACEPPKAGNARAYVTIATQGGPLRP